VTVNISSPAGPATALIEGDSDKIDGFNVVSGRRWSCVYTEGGLVRWEMFLGITFVMLQCDAQLILTSWTGDRLERR